jgi:hypothetical protein
MLHEPTKIRERFLKQSIWVRRSSTMVIAASKQRSYIRQSERFRYKLDTDEENTYVSSLPPALFAGRYSGTTRSAKLHNWVHSLVLQRRMPSADEVLTRCLTPYFITHQQLSQSRCNRCADIPPRCSTLLRVGICLPIRRQR